VKIFKRLTASTKLAEHKVRYGQSGTGHGGLGGVGIEENQRVVVLGVGKEEVVDEATELPHVGTNGFILEDASAKDGNRFRGGNKVHAGELSQAALAEKTPVGILPDLLVFSVLLVETRHGGYDGKEVGCWIGLL